MSGGGQIQCSSTVRHVACSLLYCCEGETPTEGRIRKQILVNSIVSMLYTPWAVFQRDEECFLSWQMASKAGRTWLDCKNPPNADIFLNLAVKVKGKKQQLFNLKVVKHPWKVLFYKFSSSPEPGNSLQQTDISSR